MNLDCPIIIEIHYQLFNKSKNKSVVYKCDEKD